ncbi:MAG: acyl-CoA dehydrogenase family protein [Rhodospirillales bacterium]|nr:acyl-CoA dehydrogenase family protein [Rhodospirillales bacterium]
MDFSLSEERRILRDTAARFIRDSYPIRLRHASTASEPGFSRAMWSQFAELGLIGALLPASVGGYGGAGEDLTVVMEEIGRGLVVEPFLATAVLGAGLIAEAGSDAQKTMLAEVIAGTQLLTFAHGEPEGRYSLAEICTAAVRSGKGWTLTGRKAVVANGDSADMLIVSARVSGAPTDENGLALFLLDPSLPGIARRGYASVDGGRAAEIELDGVTVGDAALIGPPGGACPVIERTIGRGVLALCAEALGAMETCRDMTIDYLRTRTQFGAPLGTFQALQHRMVDLCLEIEQARSIVILAAGKLEAPRAERERTLSAAKNLVGRVGRLVAEETIQLHGGIAMTWEYALPHYAKRLTMIDHQLGDADHHLERFIAFSSTA